MKKAFALLLLALAGCDNGPPPPDPSGTTIVECDDQTNVEDCE